MENRLIYLAAPAAETQENGIDTLGSEKPDPLKDAGAERAQLESLKAEPGGTEKTRQGKALIEGGKCSATTEDLLKKQISAVEAAVATRKNNLTPETTNALNKANEKLKATVEKQKNREAGNATADAKMNRMAGLGRADEIFKDVKISVNGKEFKWKKGEMANFKDLPLEGKKDLLKKMEEALLASPDGTEKVLAEMKKNKKLPDKWTKDGGYCDNPEKGGQTKKQAAEWLLANADKKILQAETAFKFLEGKQDLLAKAGEGMPTKNDIFEKSTSEFNKYFESLKRKIETVDAEQAAGFEKMKISEGAKIETVGTENTAAIEKEKAETTATAEKITPQLKKIAETIDLAKLRTARKNELENFGKSETATQADAQSLRERAQSGEKIGAFAAMKNALGFGKKDSEKDEAGEPKKEENLGDRANQEVAADLVGDPKKTDILAKEMNLRPGVSKEDWAKLAPLLALEKFDVPSVSGLMTPEIKSILERQAAEDSENEMKKTA